jgi:hypothetical protein
VAATAGDHGSIGRAMRPTSLPSPGRLAVPGAVAGLWLAALLARVATPPAIAAGVAVTVVLLAPGWAVWRALAPRRPAVPTSTCPPRSSSDWPS